MFLAVTAVSQSFPSSPRFGKAKAGDCRGISRATRHPAQRGRVAFDDIARQHYGSKSSRTCWHFSFRNQSGRTTCKGSVRQSPLPPTSPRTPDFAACSDQDFFLSATSSLRDERLQTLCAVISSCRICRPSPDGMSPEKNLRGVKPDRPPAKVRGVRRLRSSLVLKGERLGSNFPC